MYLAYFDESGDPGIYNSNPGHKNSEYFIYSNFYLPVKFWKNIYIAHKNFRSQLAKEEGLDFSKIEFHTREFLQAKDPYYSLFGPKIIDINLRKKVILKFCQNIGTLLPAKIITTAIHKNKIITPDNLDKNTSDNLSIEYSIRENLTRMWLDIGRQENFLVIADEGREAVIQKYCRKLQVFNPINGRDNKLESMLEDCLFKDSKDSYFLQISDLVSHLSYLWLTRETWNKKIKKIITVDFLEECFSKLQPILNLKATKQNSKAIVIFPK